MLGTRKGKKKRNRQIVLCGSFSGHNFGDVLIMRIFEKWICQAELDSDIYIPSLEPAFFYLRLTKPPSGVDQWKPDAIIFAGGGYFGGPSSKIRRWTRRLYRRFGSIAAKAIIARAPVAIIAAGVGPLPNTATRFLVRNVTKQARVITVRDEESASALKGLGIPPEAVQVTADVVFGVDRTELLELFPTTTNSIVTCRTTPAVGLHLYQGTGSSATFSSLLNAVQRFHTRLGIKLAVYLISDFAGSSAQLGAAEILKTKYGIPVTVIPYSTPGNLIHLLSTLDLVITTKLHVGITAVGLGVKTLAFPFHSKVPRFYNQLGLENQCIPLKDLTEEMAEQAMISTWYSTSIFETPPTLRDKALQNRTVLYSFVEHLP